MPDEPLHLVLKADGEKFYGTSLQATTSRGRYMAVQAAKELYATYRMTYDEMKDMQAKLIDLAEQPVDDNFGKAYMHLASTVQLAMKEWRNRDQLFFGENFVAQLAALLFFKLDDDITQEPEHAELLRRMEIFKKKGLPELILIEPLRSDLMSFGLSKNFSRKHLSAVRRDWAITRSQSQFWKSRAG